MPQTWRVPRIENENLERLPMSLPSVLRSPIPANVWIDCTYTLGSGKNSGIERVVRNLCRFRERIPAGTHGTASATVVINDKIFRIDESIAAAFRRVQNAEGNILAAMPWIYKLLARSLCAAIPSRGLRKWLLPQPGHLGAFKLPHRILLKHLHNRVSSRYQPIAVSRGDWLIMPDAYWACMDVWRAVQLAREAGAFVVCVVYDIIPITHPEFVGEHRRQRAIDNLKQVASNADLILTISETVRDEVVGILPTLMDGIEYCRDIRSFRLGAEICQSDDEPRLELQEIFGSRSTENPYLTVAAFDPRKNHGYLMEAFERLWMARPQEKLCLVGRVGARCEDLVDRIRSHPRFGRELYMFHDLSDNELEFCYRRSKGVIFPSIVEGFGLPIVEALWHRKKTFASDTPIHREVGGEGCEYFDLGDPRQLAEKLVAWNAVAHEEPALLGGQHPLTWAQSVDQFAQECSAGYRDWLQRRDRRFIERDKHAA